MLGWTREHQAGKAMPVTDLLKITDGKGWDSGNISQHYSAAGAVAHFCMEAENRRYRSDFVDFLRDSYRNSTSGHPLWDYLGLTRDAFLSAYEAWAITQHGAKRQSAGDPLDS
jgi:hypothetical protein